MALCWLLTEVSRVCFEFSCSLRIAVMANSVKAIAQPCGTTQAQQALKRTMARSDSLSDHAGDSFRVGRL